jgi:hypothetical protein
MANSHGNAQNRGSRRNKRRRGLVPPTRLSVKSVTLENQPPPNEDGKHAANVIKQSLIVLAAWASALALWGVTTAAAPGLLADLWARFTAWIN